MSAADELKKARAAYAAGHAHRDPKAVKDAVTRIQIHGAQGKAGGQR